MYSLPPTLAIGSSLVVYLKFAYNRERASNPGIQFTPQAAATYLSQGLRIDAEIADSLSRMVLGIDATAENPIAIIRRTKSRTSDDKIGSFLFKNHERLHLDRAGDVEFIQTPESLAWQDIGSKTWYVTGVVRDRIDFAITGKSRGEGKRRLPLNFDPFFEQAMGAGVILAEGEKAEIIRRTEESIFLHYLRSTGKRLSSAFLFAILLYQTGQTKTYFQADASFYDGLLRVSAIIFNSTPNQVNSKEKTEYEWQQESLINRETVALSDSIYERQLVPQSKKPD